MKSMSEEEYNAYFEEDDMGDIEYEEDEYYLAAVKEAKNNPDKLMDYTYDNIRKNFHSGQIIDWVKEFDLSNNRQVIKDVLNANDLHAVIAWHLNFDTFTDVIVDYIIKNEDCVLAEEWVNTFNENVEEFKQLIINTPSAYIKCRWILYVGDDYGIRESVIRKNLVKDYVDIVSNETDMSYEKIMEQLYDGMPNDYKLGVIL